MKKKNAIIKLVIAVFLIGMLAIPTVLWIGASQAPTAPSIDYATVVFADAVDLRYFVKSDDAGETSLLIWNRVPAGKSFTESTADDVLTNYYKDTVSMPGKTYKAFTYDEVSAKEMSDTYYVRAMYKQEDTTLYSSVVKYSIKQYVENMKADYTGQDRATLIPMLESMLDYGASAQAHFDNYNINHPANGAVASVTVVGGTIAEDGFTHGLYYAGDIINLVFPEKNSEDVPFSHFEDAAGNEITIPYTVTGTEGAMKLTAVYQNPLTTTIKVGNYNLKNYKIVTDGKSDSNTVASYVREQIFQRTGVALEYAAPGEVPEYTFKFEINDNYKASNYPGKGFSVVPNGKTLTLSCASWLRIYKGAINFINEKIPTNASEIDLIDGYEWDIALRYSEFENNTSAISGAPILPSDGVTDAFDELRLIHLYANEYKLKVIADTAHTYYIGDEPFTEIVGGTKVYQEDVIAIKTDVDFGNCTFIIDDSIVPAWLEARSRKIFEVQTSSDEEASYIPNGTIMSTFNAVLTFDDRGNAVFKHEDGSPLLEKGATKFGNMEFQTDVMLYIQTYNNDERVYIRKGVNANSGAYKSEVILVHKDGSIDDSTPIIYDNYKSISYIIMTPINTEPVTIKNGTFITKANRAPKDEAQAREWHPEFINGISGATVLPIEYGSRYYGYSRNFYITRSNTTIDGMKHKVQDEGETGYPYYQGWLYVNNCNNILIKDSKMSAHKCYNGINANGNAVSMGSYDLIAQWSNNVTWKNVTEYTDITISNSELWGIMSSNFSKNLTYDHCRLSRFDAHQGVHNITIKFSKIGKLINLVGSGDCNITDTEKYCGPAFISLRADYGSTWEGNVNITNSNLLAYYTTTTGLCDESGDIDRNKDRSVYQGAGLFDLDWANHNFGYTCYMPKNITLDKFHINPGAGVNVYLFKFATTDTATINSTIFESKYNGNTNNNKYIKPASLIIKNLPASPNAKKYFILSNVDNLFAKGTIPTIKTVSGYTMYVGPSDKTGFTPTLYS